VVFGFQYLIVNEMVNRMRTQIEPIYNRGPKGTRRASPASESIPKSLCKCLCLWGTRESIVSDCSSKTEKNNLTLWLACLNIVSTYSVFEGEGRYPISEHCKRSVPGKVGPEHELPKFITGSPPVPKKSVRKASATTSTLGSSQTDASVPPSCPQLHSQMGFEWIIY
jgi:hypothetical protein